MSPKFKDFNSKPKILQMPLTAPVSSTTAISPVMQPPLTLIEFVTTVPTPLASELVILAPYIQAIRHFAQIISWESSWEESWLALATWWAFCLLSEPTLRFFLPLAVSFVLALRRWTSSTHVSSAITPPVVTDGALHALVSDLTTIRALLPSSPLVESPLPPSFVLLRVLAFIYLPYLILTSFVGLRICIALCGTMFMIHRAHWARHARASITRSAHIRWAFYRLCAFVSGVPLSPPASPSPLEASTKIRPASVLADDEPKPSPPLRFLFTVYENQRWWMGLDWTAALLPNERPSWCSSSLVPLSPPSVFPLPASTTAYVAVGKNGRAKRVASWTWEEPEWRVIIRKEGQGGVWRVEKTPPKDKDGPDESTATRMLRAARGRDLNTSSSGPAESPEPTGEQHSSNPFLDSASEDEAVTDPEGWLYGDNKWEGASSKGGMGKYTRFRRWTRIAVLSETVELVGPGDLGVVRDSMELSGYGTATSSIFGSTGTPSISAISPTLSSFSDLDMQSTVTAPEPQRDVKDGQDSGSMRNMLRQRLKAVVEGTTH